MARFVVVTAARFVVSECAGVVTVAMFVVVSECAGVVTVAKFVVVSECTGVGPIKRGRDSVVPGTFCRTCKVPYLGSSNGLTGMSSFA